jgi:peptidoglycan/LPS O-acetylase OafA/YrhL
MKWFKGLKGARGWLAWIVVASHIVQLTALDHHFGALKVLQIGGDLAVDVFIIMSGFVIYNLILEKREPYAAYITRRFMRIYPVYLACLALGVVATLLTFQLLPHQPWGADLPITPRLVAQMESARGAGLFEHLVAHLTLLHGAIPNNVLMESQYFFLSPGWSLSLEWQFYLVAPFVVFCIRNKTSQIGLAVACVLLAYGYKKGLFGDFSLPSYLPGAIFLFATGLVTRAIIPKLHGQFQLSPALLIVAAGGIAMRDYGLLHFAAWLVLVSYMISVPARDFVGSLSQRALQTILDSPMANWLGRRSYAVCLVHVPVTQLVIYGSSALLGLSYKDMVLGVVVLTPALTLVLSDLLHRFVEKPGVDLGHTMANALTAHERPALRRI